MILETATQQRVKKELDKKQRGFKYATDAEMYKDYKQIRGQVRKNVNQLLKAERGELKGRYESLNNATSPALFLLRMKNVDLDIDPEIMDEKSIKNHFRAFSQFLISETGTLKNWDAYHKRTLKRIEEITGVKNLDENEFFAVWDRIKSLELNIKAESLFNLGSEEVMEYIGAKMKAGLHYEDIIESFKSHLKYLENEQIKREEEGLNDPFNI